MSDFTNSTFGQMLANPLNRSVDDRLADARKREQELYSQGAEGEYWTDKGDKYDNMKKNRMDLEAQQAAAGGPQTNLPAAPDAYNFSQDYLNHQAGMIDTVMNSQAPTIDTSGATAAMAGTMRNLGQDQAAMQAQAANDPSRQHLLQLANGQGPAAEAAQAQLRAGLDASNAQAMSQAASARGGAGAQGLAARGALMAGAQNSQQAANQAAATRAAMSMQGIQGLSQQRGEDLSANLGLAGLRAGAGNQFMGQLGNMATAQGNLTGNYNIGKYGIAQGGMNNMGGYSLGAQGNAIGAENAQTNRDTAATNRGSLAVGAGNQAEGKTLGAWSGGVQAVDTAAKSIVPTVAKKV